MIEARLSRRCKSNVCSRVLHVQRVSSCLLVDGPIMARSDDDPSAAPTPHASAALHQIADALGTSVETFFPRSQPENEAVNAEELLRLWADLPDAQARRRVLSQLRFEVERHRLNRGPRR